VSSKADENEEPASGVAEIAGVDIAGVNRPDAISQGNYFTATRGYRDYSKAHKRRMAFVIPPDGRQQNLSR